MGREAAASAYSYICNPLIPVTHPALSLIRRKLSKKQSLQEDEEDSDDDDKRKDKKLVFLSRSVLQQVRTRPMVTGTQIANEILEMYK